MSNRELELICRSLKGQTSSEEERELREWRNSSSNEMEYLQMVRLLETVSAAASEDHASYIPTASDIISLAERAAPNLTRQQRFIGRAPVFRTLLAAAAVVVLLVGGLYFARQSGQPDFRMGSGEYVSGPNETTTATLGDGTVVRLAPGSRLRILDSPGRRDVFLSGHAFLAVAPMAELPFRVRTSHGDVVVLGTRFDVKAAEVLRVVVVEGKVSLRTGSDRVDIPAGQMSMVMDGGLVQPVAVDVRPLVAWVRPFIAFQGTPLRDVARELEHAYDARVILQDSTIANLTVTGWYINRSFEEVVVIVCGVVGAQCSIHDRTATIGK